MKEQFLDDIGLEELIGYIKKYVKDDQDVKPYASYSVFPKTGEQNIIYIDTTNNLTYYWDDTSKTYKALDVQTWGNLSGKPSTFPPSTHNHDDRYYTETEINTKLAGKANSSHTHKKADITDFPTSMPASDVKAWAKASNKPSYSWGEITGKPSSFTPASHTHNYAGSGSAGGSANSAVKLDSSAGSATQPIYFSGGKPTACSYTINASVPSGAKFTDTNTWRGIQNNLSSDSTTDSLSAAQGKRLKELVDGKTDIHNLNYGIRFSSSSMDSNASQNTLYPAKYENGAYSKTTGVSTYANRNDTIHIGTSSNMFGDICLAGSITSLGVYNVTTTTNLPVSVTSRGYLRRYKSGSSLMIKNHIYKIGYDEAKELLNTNVYSFRYNDDGQPANGKEHAAIDRYGFVLEDMEKTFPMAVEYDEDGLPAAWCVQIIVPTILEIVKHQQAEISSLKAENEELKEKISEIDELKKSLDELRVLITDK